MTLLGAALLNVFCSFTQGRVLAAIFYLSDVAEGGETVFYRQGGINFFAEACFLSIGCLSGVTIKPVIGNIAMFPTGFTHAHAGVSPRRGVK